MDKKRKDEYKAAAVVFLLCCALLYLGLVMPVFFAALPLIAVYGVARSGAAGAAAALAGFASAAFVNPLAALALAALFLPVALAAGYMIRSKKRFRDCVIVSVGAVFAGAALAIAVFSLDGVPAVERIVGEAGNAIKTLGDGQISSFYQMLRYPDVLTGAITQQAVASTPAAQAVIIMQGMLKNMLDVWFVTIIGIYSLLFGLLCYVVPRAAVKRSMEVVKVPAFSELALPKGFWIAFALSYIFAAVGESYGWKSFDVLGVTVYNLYAFVFLIQALSLLDFLYKKRGFGTGARTVFHVLSTIVLSYILVWVGIFENVASIRKRMDERQA